MSNVPKTSGNRFTVSPSKYARSSASVTCSASLLPYKEVGLASPRSAPSKNVNVISEGVSAGSSPLTSRIGLTPPVSGAGAGASVPVSSVTPPTGPPLGSKPPVSPAGALLGSVVGVPVGSV